MSNSSRDECRVLSVVRDYAQHLRRRRLADVSRKLYCSQVVSFLVELAISRNLVILSESLEEQAYRAAKRGDSEELNGLRSQCVTAFVLTASRRELGEVLLAISKDRSVPSMASFVSVTGSFFAWLKTAGLIEVNHFDTLKARLVFRCGQLRLSIERAMS